MIGAAAVDDGVGVLVAGTVNVGPPVTVQTSHSLHCQEWREYGSLLGLVMRGFAHACQASMSSSGKRQAASLWLTGFQSPERSVQHFLTASTALASNHAAHIPAFTRLGMVARRTEKRAIEWRIFMYGRE
jgi:hypothetical protein